MSLEQRSVDVVFVGGGISAQLIGRYIKKNFPNKKILILERNTSGKWSPGESTVGVAGLFLIRDLDLSTYCYLNHLPKNGLRYFFENPEEDFALERCSEIGSNIFPVFPTFQLDRKKFSEDLWRLNAQMGIEVELGAEVLDCNIQEGSAFNYISYRKDNTQHTIQCDWIVHATGRSGRILPKLHAKNPVKIDADHQISAAWGRYTGVNDLDTMGSKQWRKRVGYTSRYLSTIHCMGKGFWIWIIPIGENVVSFGIVFDRTIVDQKDQTQLMKKDGFDQYIKKHPFVSNLLNDAQMLDFQCADQLAYKRDKFCDVDHWAFIGESFGFIDPFYSPGSDVIARQAHLLEHLLSSEHSKLQSTVDLLNQYCNYEFELIKQLYVGQYEGFGSFDVFNIKGLWDFHTYSNRMIWNFYDERYKDLNFLKREVDSAPMSLRLTQAIQKGFIALKDFLTQKKCYSSNNLDRYSLRQNRFRNEEDMLLDYDEAKSMQEHMQICQLCISEMLNIRFNLQGMEHRAIIQDNLSFAVMQNFELSSEWMANFCQRIGKSLSRKIKRLYGFELNFDISLEDFGREIPQFNLPSVSDVSLRVNLIETLKTLWRNPSKNAVLDELVLPSLRSK